MSGTGRGTGRRCRAALWAFTVVCGGVASRGASAAPVIASQSDAFVDSVGINIHATHYLGFTTTTYDNWPAVMQAVQTLGVRNVRDHIFDTDRLNQLTTATGAKVTAIMEQHVVNALGAVLDPTKIPDLVNLAKQVNGLIAMEG